MISQQPSAQEARTAAEEILEGGDYGRIHEDSGVIGDAYREVATGYMRLVGWIEELHQDSPVLYWLLLFALLAILGLLIFHIVWSFRQALRAEPLEEGLDIRGTGVSVEQ